MTSLTAVPATATTAGASAIPPGTSAVGSEARNSLSNRRSVMGDDIPRAGGGSRRTDQRFGDTNSEGGEPASKPPPPAEASSSSEGAWSGSRDGNHQQHGQTASATAGAGNASSSSSAAVPQGQQQQEQTISYSAERIIGNGSFGVVFQAAVVETGEVVAIKKVLQDKRFKNRELQIMRQLVKDPHSNIVALKHCFYSQVCLLL